jgi:Lambda phage tail tube protein, TTP
MSNSTAAIFTLTGGQFQLETTFGSGTFTPISQVKSVDFGSFKVDTPEVTSADNTDGIKRFVATLQDHGDVTVTIIYNTADATHQALRTASLALGSAATHNYKVVNPTGFLTYSFQGIITSFDTKMTLDKDTELTVKIKISGPLTLA